MDYGNVAAWAGVSLTALALLRAALQDAWFGLGRKRAAALRAAHLAEAAPPERKDRFERDAISKFRELESLLFVDTRLVTKRQWQYLTAAALVSLVGGRLSMALAWYATIPATVVWYVLALALFIIGISYGGIRKTLRDLALGARDNDGVVRAPGVKWWRVPALYLFDSERVRRECKPTGSFASREINDSYQRIADAAWSMAWRRVLRGRVERATDDLPSSTSVLGSPQPHDG